MWRETSCRPGSSISSAAPFTTSDRASYLAEGSSGDIARREDHSRSGVTRSQDPLEKATETMKEHSLGFPVGYALPLRETASTLGAFFEEQRGFFQATGFVVKPDRTIAVSQ